MVIYRKTFFFRMICFLILKEVDNYILIKLKKLESLISDEEYSPEILINNMYNKYYGLINIGNPSQLTEFQLSCNIVDLSLSEKICLTDNYFNKNKSISLSQVSIKNPLYPFDLDYIYANDTLKFMEYDTKLKIFNEIDLNNYTFLYESENENEKSLNKNVTGKACALFGLKIMCQTNRYYCRSFLDVLKDNKIIKSKNFIINYYKEKKDNYDAEIILGEYPHEYNKDIYNISKYYKSTAEISDDYSVPDWIMNIQNYFYTSNGTKINFYLTRTKQYMQANFTFDLNYIIGINEYLYEIKNHYFNNHLDVCQINKVKYRYTVITCDKNFIADDFPTLYFENIGANYILELTYKDLFQIRGDKNYFLIIFDQYNVVPWRFGKIFMQKYLFNFDADNRVIGYYIPIENSNNTQNEDENNGDKNYYLIIWISLIILTGAGCLFLGAFLFKKSRKKRANEMKDDDYEYIQESKEKSLNEDKKDDNLGIN